MLLSRYFQTENAGRNATETWRTNQNIVFDTRHCVTTGEQSQAM